MSRVRQDGRVSSGTMRNAGPGWALAVFAGLLGGVLGCGTPFDGDEPALENDEALGELEQPITGGILDPAFPSVVKLMSPLCTAFKVGTFKFVTAAHCLPNPAVTSVTIRTDALATAASSVTLSIPPGGIQIHASYTLMGVGVFNDYYDVAVITTTTATPSVPSVGLANHIPTTLPIVATVPGYGCDSNDPSHSGKRQSGDFNLTASGGRVMASVGPLPIACGGDSGSPAIPANGLVIGIAKSGSAPGTGSTSTFTRVSNVINFINDPKPPNGSALLQAGGDMFFMHRKLVSGFPLGMCAAAAAASGPSPGVPVVLQPCVDKAGVLNGNKAPGWSAVSIAPAGRFLLINHIVGKCLGPESAGSGANLRLQTCALDGSNNFQKWFFTTASAPNIPSMQIKNHSTGLCVSSENNGTSAGTNVEQVTCTAASSDSVQSWVATR